MSHELHRRNLLRWATTIVLVCLLLPVHATAQSTSDRDLHPETRALLLTLKELSLTVPMPYLREQHPTPAPPGAYRWRLVPNHPALPALLIGTDARETITDLQTIAARLEIRLCPHTTSDGQLPTLDQCRTRVSGKAFTDVNSIVIVINDASVVAAWREHAPTTLWRHTFEPMGRYRIEEIGVVYKTFGR